MNRTYTVPPGATSIYAILKEAFKTSKDNYFLVADGSQFYVKKDDGTIQMLNNIYTRELESREHTVAYEV